MENQTKKPGKVGVVFFGIWVCIAFLLVQGIIGAIGVIPLVVEAMQQAGGDPAMYQQIYMEKLGDGSALSSLQFFASIASTVVVAIWYFFGYVKKGISEKSGETLKKNICNVNNALLIVVGSIAIYALAVFIQLGANALMPNVGSLVEEMLNITATGNPVLGFISVVILAPIGEELCIRGIVVSKAKQAYGVVGCMVISGLLFGFLHMNPIQGLYAIPMGLFWGFLAYKTNSVIPSMICHAINNALAMLFSALGVSENLAMFGALLVVGAVVAIYFGRKAKFVDVEVANDVAETVAE